jgi:hypothetical protein
MPPSVFPSGVTISDSAKAYHCFALFDGRDGRSYLVDMAGNDVNVWPYSGFPAKMIDPALNEGKRGHILCQGEDDTFSNDTLLEVDWNGDVVWRWREGAPGGSARQNHDVSRLPNGNTLVLSKAARDVPGVHDVPFNDQPIYEVSPDGAVRWTWFPSDHLEALGIVGERKAHLFSPTRRPANYILVINDAQPVGPNRHHDAEDARFHPDNIVIDSREANFVAIVDRATGEIVWRIGPDFPASHDFSKRRFVGDLPRPVDSLSGPHDAHVIAEGLPGAGNILLFDNQGPAGLPQVNLGTFPGSRILEIDPLSKQIVWQFDASCHGAPFWMFHSSFVSSARRLPNGNTLICEGMHGRIFQVTREGEIVWEYINPHFGEWKSDRVFFGGRVANWIYRAQPIEPDWIPDGVAGP